MPLRHYAINYAIVYFHFAINIFAMLSRHAIIAAYINYAIIIYATTLISRYHH